MTDHTTALDERLSAALQRAGAVAQARLGKPLQVTAGNAPASNALLRFEVKFSDAASLVWYVSNEDATGFSDLLIGGTGDRTAALTDMHVGALSGVFEEMLGGAIDAINAGLTDQVVASGIDMGMEGALPAPPAGARQTVARFEIEGFGELVIVQHATAALVQLVQARSPQGAAAAGAAPAAAAAASQAPPAGAPAGAAAPAAGAAYDNVVQFPDMGSATTTGNDSDLRLLLNVPLNVTVELGRTERTVRDLLELNVGSILELSKLAGDPMDIMVNGKVLARGEVVVIDEEFGVRVTEILSPEKRLRQLG